MSGRASDTCRPKEEDRAVPGFTFFSALVFALLTSCNLPSPPPTERRPFEEEPEAARVRPRVAPGQSCTSRADCAGHQRCVQQRCSPYETSHRGELLAYAARAEAHGNSAMAVELYGAAIAAFEEDELPVPAEIVCELALQALSARNSDAEQETALHHAHRCVRESLIGSELREAVLQKVAATSYHRGLAPNAMDDEAPSSFLTDAPRAPLSGAIEVDIRRSRVGAETEDPNLLRAVRACFLRDWESSRRLRIHALFRVRTGRRLAETQAPPVEVETDDSVFSQCLRVHLEADAFPQAQPEAIRIRAELP